MAPLPEPLIIAFTVGLYVASIFGLLCLGHWLDVRREKKDNQNITQEDKTTSLLDAANAGYTEKKQPKPIGFPNYHMGYDLIKEKEIQIGKNKGDPAKVRMPIVTIGGKTTVLNIH